MNQDFTGVIYLTNTNNCREQDILLLQAGMDLPIYKLTLLLIELLSQLKITACSVFSSLSRLDHKKLTMNSFVVLTIDHQPYHEEDAAAQLPVVVSYKWKNTICT